MKKYFFLMYYTLKSYSLCRILQIWQMQFYKLEDNTIEFGASDKFEKNFYFYSKKYVEKNIILSNINNKKLLYINLANRINLKKRFKNILLFNVLEHLDDHNFSLKEISKLLKKNGSLFGSTPFLYRVHGAPNDCYRFTKYIFEKKLLFNFKNKKIENLGYGPFTACYSIISDYTKFIPVLNNVLLTFTIIIDKIIGLFIKTPLRDIYPIAIFFIVKKK